MIDPYENAWGQIDELEPAIFVHELLCMKSPRSPTQCHGAQESCDKVCTVVSTIQGRSNEVQMMGANPCHIK